MSAETPVVTRSPENLCGTPVFGGTRVPVKTRIDYLEVGDSLEVFLLGFPYAYPESRPLPLCK